MAHVASHLQYAQPITKRGKKDVTAEVTEEKKLSHHAQRNLDERKKGMFYVCLYCRVWIPTNLRDIDAKIDPLLESQFAAGRLYAAISSRPGQSGRADGYVLEGKELEVSCLLCRHEVR